MHNLIISLVCAAHKHRWFSTSFCRSTPDLAADAWWSLYCSWVNAFTGCITLHPHASASIPRWFFFEGKRKSFLNVLIIIWHCHAKCLPPVRHLDSGSVCVKKRIMLLGHFPEKIVQDLILFMCKLFPDDEAGREGEEGEIENDAKQTLAAHPALCLLDQQVDDAVFLFFFYPHLISYWNHQANWSPCSSCCFRQQPSCYQYSCG